MTSTQHEKSTRRRRVLAILAAGTAMSAASLTTLASWNDNEWVFGGGQSGSDGVGTSTFEVWQNRANKPPTGAEASGWDDQETNPGGALTFTADTSNLTPGDVIYAPVALQTKAGSGAGTLSLQTAVPAAGQTPVDAGDELWNALEFAVKVADTPSPCADEDWAGAGTEIATGTGLGTAVPASTQPVSADRGNVQYYCFRIELPATAPDGLQGRSVYPAWRFAAVST